MPILRFPDGYRIEFMLLDATRYLDKSPHAAIENICRQLKAGSMPAPVLLT
jgi:hypothetical protein